MAHPAAGPATPAEEAPGVILVVDDDSTGRYVLSSWLKRAGHRVVEAADGASGLAAAAPDAQPRPEVAIIDVGLPDMSGFEVCERIKADPATTGIPVVHISATAIAVNDRTQGLYRGADAYLTEPIEPDELLATITAILRYARARRRAEQLTARLTALNQATLELYRATGFGALAAAAATGAVRMMSGWALGVFLSPAGASVSTGVAAPGAAPVTAPADPEVLETLARRALAGRVGAGTAIVPAQSWTELFAASAPESVPEPGGDVEVAAVRTKPSRPPVCLAVPAHAVRTPEDRTVLIQLAQATALALESLRAYAEEHALALALQRSFLPDPSRLPAVPGVGLAVRYVPATSHTEVGGDFYEALGTRHGLLLAIGDVVGHSLESAVLMGEVRHALRAYAVAGHDPESILELLDALVRDLRPTLTTVTLCLVLIEPDGRHIQVCNAGHIPPLVIDPGSGARFLPEHGPLLGIGLAQPRPTRHALARPSRLLLVTDGLVEVPGVLLDESLEQLRACAATGPADLDGLCDYLLDRLGKDKGDDIAVLACSLTH